MVFKGLKITGNTYADLIKKSGKQFQIPNINPQFSTSKKRRKNK